MSFETLTNLLAARDGWEELIGTLALLGFYAAAAIFKAVTNRAAKSKADTSEPEITAAAREKPRYKPLTDTASPAQISQAKTLPYARAAAQPGQKAPVAQPVLRPTGQLSEWDRQQELKRRRVEQIEALRRQQIMQVQQAQRKQQQQRQQHPASPPVPARPAPVSPIIQKTVQESLHQVRTGRPVTGGAAVVRPALSQVRQAAATPKATAQTIKASVHHDKENPVFHAAGKLRSMLREPHTLRTAIMLKEILDTPLGLRDL